MNRSVVISIQKTEPAGNNGMSRSYWTIGWLTLLLTGWLTASPLRAGEPFAIEVVDAATQRGVPLIELRTVNEIRLVTDSAGLVAFDEPGLMGRSVFFHVRGHGYEHAKDGFGYRGRKLDVVAGGRARIEVQRRNIAERLYRSTGAGIYRDSVLLGRSVPIAEPLLNGQVLGQDSVLEATFGGKIHWFWGDTNRPSYPLGTFGTPGATSELPGQPGGLDPESGVNLTYYKAPDGFVTPTADLAGPGPTWLDGLAVIPDPSRPGGERMFAAFAKVRPSMAPYRRGIAEFDSTSHRFSEVTPVPLDAPIHPFGHPFLHQMGGVTYVVFADPYPLVRVQADPAHLTNLAQYEAFTCLLPGSSPARGPVQVDRGEDGRARYQWRRQAPPISADRQKRLIADGHLQADEAMVALRDPETGRAVTLARGSTYWNDHRHRWVLVGTEVGGESSNLGEVWFAEADAPVGPWVYARKIVTHDKYSFYNPKQHPTFAQANGRIIFFEGTYTHTFSSTTDPTPRYDYNQITYKLDLDDDRLNLPRPVYEVDGGYRFGPVAGRAPVFFALDRPSAASVSLGAFHALASDQRAAPATTIPLYEVEGVEPGQSRRFTLGDRPGAKPVGLVWPSPTRFAVPE